MSDLLGHVTTIKAISIWQPWASLLARGIKRHETRHWATEYRGPIAIHAAKTLDLAGAPAALCDAAFGPMWPKTLPTGAVVAIGRLAACRKAETVAEYLSRADLAAGNFTPGRFAWAIDEVRALATPVPTVGRQGLFNWPIPAGLESQLGPVLDHAAACRLIGW